MITPLHFKQYGIIILRLQETTLFSFGKKQQDQMFHQLTLDADFLHCHVSNIPIYQNLFPVLTQFINPFLPLFTSCRFVNTISQINFFQQPPMGCPNRCYYKNLIGQRRLRFLVYRIRTFSVTEIVYTITNQKHGLHKVG